MADSETTTKPHSHPEQKTLIRELRDRYEVNRAKLAYDLASQPDAGDALMEAAEKEASDLIDEVTAYRDEEEDPEDAAWVLDIAMDQLFSDKEVGDSLDAYEERAIRLLKRAREIAIGRALPSEARQRNVEQETEPTARDIVFNMEEDVRTLGEYAKVLLFMAAGCRTHGDATEALERVAIDMIARGEQLEAKYAALWTAVGIVPDREALERATKGSGNE
jgi:hypothetical protein